jgi:hypothetical protein
MIAARCANELLAAAVVVMDVHSIAPSAPGRELRLAPVLAVEAKCRQA